MRFLFLVIIGPGDLIGTFCLITVTGCDGVYVLWKSVPVERSYGLAPFLSLVLKPEKNVLMAGSPTRSIVSLSPMVAAA